MGANTSCRRLVPTMVLSIVAAMPSLSLAEDPEPTDAPHSAAAVGRVDGPRNELSGTGTEMTSHVRCTHDPAAIPPRTPALRHVVPRREGGS